MSVRMTSVKHPKSKTAFERVLRVGTQMHQGAEKRATITIQGVIVSTDWKNWTPMSSAEIMNLRLNPVDPAEFVEKGSGGSAAAKYVGTEFKSPYTGYWSLWVEYLGYVRDADIKQGKPEYYVLATSDSMYKYVRGQQPFFDHQGKRYFKE